MQRAVSSGVTALVVLVAHALSKLHLMASKRIHQGRLTHAGRTQQSNGLTAGAPRQQWCHAVFI